MQLTQTEGVVLKSYNLAEADRIIVVFTRQSGLIRGVARGARKLKSRFSGSLEPFTSILLTFTEKEGRELVTLTSTEIRQSLFSLTQRPEVLTLFAYMSNLLIRFSPPHEPNETLYRMIIAIMDALKESNSDPEALKRYFDVWLLKLSGFLPDVKRCFGCGTGFGAGNAASFDADLRFLCSDCAGVRGQSVNAGALKLIREALVHSPVNFSDRFKEIDLESRDRAADLLDRYFERVLESESGTAGNNF